MKVDKVKQILLIGHSFVFLSAFASLYFQIPGLYGEDGLLPVTTKLNCGKNGCSSLRAGVNVLPFMVNFLRIAPSAALQIVALTGMLFASLSTLYSSWRHCFSYLVMFICYSSAINVGDTFLWFQWDSLLLESGALCVLLAPVPFIGATFADNVSLFLMRWLVFRLMYASGVVKLTSGCPSWWSLSALSIHFQGQCLPTWVAYYAHQAPQWMLRFGVAFTFYIEIALPLMFLLPFKAARAFSFYPQIILMVLIMITGNYNFFTAVYAIQCVSLLADSGEHKFSTQSIARRYVSARFASLLSTFGSLISFAIVAVSLALFVSYFSVRLDGLSLSTRIAFSKSGFTEFVDKTVLYALYFGVCAFVLECFAALVRFFTERHSSRICALLHLIYVLLVGSLLFAVSLIPFASLSRSAQSVIPKKVNALHESLNPYQLTHAYGLFRRMTGVDGRPEIIIEGSYEPNGPWKPFEFYAKPVHLDTKPRFILPHQPRLDWQMWFAALGAYQHSQFFISLTHHLLLNNSEVTYLMGHYPFERKLPRFIRAHLFFYFFTGPDHQGKWPKNYWRRAFQEEYMPPLTKDDPGVLAYLQNSGVLLTKKFVLKDENYWLERIVRSLHLWVRQFDPAQMIHAILLAHFVVIFSRNYIGTLLYPRDAQVRA